MRRVPAVEIVLRFEESPRVRILTDSDADFARLADWIHGNEPLYEIVRDAVELAREQRPVT